MRVSYFKRRGMVPKRRRHYGLTFKGEEGKVPRRIAIGALILIVIIIIARATRTEPSLMNSAEIATVRDRGALNVGVRDDVPGFGENGDGLEVALGTRLAERIMESDPDWDGYTDAASFVTVTSMSVGAALDDGSIDVAIALMPKDGSSKYAYSDPYYTDTCRFVVRKGDESRMMKDLTVGYIKSSTTTSVYVQTSYYASMLNAYIKAHPDDGIEKKAYAAYDEMFTALIKGNIDAVVMDDVLLARYTDAYNIEKSGTELGKVEYAIACPSGTPAFVSIANIMLTEMKKDGSLDALLAQYGLGGS